MPSKWSTQERRIDRSALMCANPTCYFLVHEDPAFGNYCCKKCHWRHESSSKGKQKHGGLCAQKEAKPDAKRADAVPPVQPCSWGCDVGASAEDPTPGSRGSGGSVASVELPKPKKRKRTELPSAEAEVEEEPKEAIGRLRNQPFRPRVRPARPSAEDWAKRSAACAPSEPSRRRTGEGQSAEKSSSSKRPVNWPAERDSGAAVPRPRCKEPSGKGRKDSAAPGMALKASIIETKQGQLEGESYGISNYKLFEGCSFGQEEEQPLLFVWLHGSSMGQIDTKDLLNIHKRLGRHTVFLVPMNPKAVSTSGLHFMWGAVSTKAQNKCSLGFVNGRLHEPYLKDLCKLIREVTAEVMASHVCVCGYSMGGFGVYQLASYDPEAFDVAVSIAGYVLGTLEPQDRGLRAPQPMSSEVFWRFLTKQVSQLARVPLLLVVHAKSDETSSYMDAETIVDRINHASGCGEAKLKSVPKAFAGKTGHRYYNYALLDDHSEEVLYSDLRRAFDNIMPRTKRWKLHKGASAAASERIGGARSKSRPSPLPVPRAIKSRAPSAASAKGHPDCTMKEDCGGRRDSSLVQHIMEGKPGDIYCQDCWELFCEQCSFLKCRSVDPVR
mmetsp:Transcript_64011/g.139183  ORF Transcript_64011/g.139183 Transcript_64011/m.139183 type:complete len:610 (+) Transcript_64011:93-1922(+)